MNAQNPTCQHQNIDIKTARCNTCDELMEGVHITYDTVKSAPNLAAGSGVYIPDRRNEKEVVVGTNYDFVCKRCPQEGSIYEDGELKWGCGNAHRGIVE
jgi:hypothetical protein